MDPETMKRLAMLMMAQGQQPMAGGRPNPLGIAAQTMGMMGAMGMDPKQKLSNLFGAGADVLDKITGGAAGNAAVNMLGA
jgi:hypothetical protein